MLLDEHNMEAMYKDVKHSEKMIRKKKKGEHNKVSSRKFSSLFKKSSKDIKVFTE